jgi:hypothetical protein
MANLSKSKILNSGWLSLTQIVSMPQKVQFDTSMRFDSIVNLVFDVYFSISMQDPSWSCGLDIKWHLPCQKSAILEWICAFLETQYKYLYRHIFYFKAWNLVTMEHFHRPIIVFLWISPLFGRFSKFILDKPP